MFRNLLFLKNYVSLRCFSNSNLQMVLCENYLNFKSDENRRAADFLNEKGLHAPSVHCAYYSCLQLLKYVITFSLKKTEDDISRDMNRSRSDSHIYFEKTVSNEIKDFSNRKIFVLKFRELKILRIASDYSLRKIQKQDSDEALKLSVEISKIIKNTFHV